MSVWCKTAALLCLCFFLAVLPTQAAGFHPDAQAQQQGAAAVVTVNGAAALRIRVAADGKSPSDRAQEIAARLASLACPQKIKIVPINRRAIALETVGGSLVAVATNGDARTANTSLDALARSWAATLGKLLSMPALTLSLKHPPLIVPTGQWRSVIIGGSAPASDVSAKDVSSSTTRSTYDQATRKLMIAGVAPGRTEVIVAASDDQGAEAQQIIPVIVEDPAANVGRTASARVTGSPVAPKDLVIQAVYNALYGIITANAGARVALQESPDVTHDLPAGQSMTVIVPIRADGPNMVTVEAKPAITITNDDTVPKLTASTLFYSNDPEKVTKPQTLFCAAESKLSRPVRLVYHHVNGSADPLTLGIEVINRGSTDSTLHIVQGRAGPAGDPIQAGFRAGGDFLRGLVANDGLVLDLPARSRLTLMADRLPPGQTFSGYIQMTQIGDQASDLVVRVTAEAVSQAPPDPLDCLVHPINGGGGAYPVTALADDDSSAQYASDSDDIFESPNVVVPTEYDVGGRWLYLYLGTAHAIARRGNSADTLDGNYGVVYIYTITLTNPTKEPRTVTLQFLAQAGLAAGLFLVDNTQWISLNASNGIDEDITRVTLEPGQSHTLQVETMPLSGSAYPAALIAHAL